MDKKNLVVLILAAIVLVSAVIIISEQFAEYQRLKNIAQQEDLFRTVSIKTGETVKIADLNLTLIGEGIRNCENYPSEVQSRCKEDRFFVFYPESEIPFKIMQGHFGAYIALEGREKYISMEQTAKDTVTISSSSEIVIDSIKGYYEIRILKTEGKFIQLQIEFLH